MESQPVYCHKNGTECVQMIQTGSYQGAWLKEELHVRPLSHKIETDRVNSMLVNQNSHHVLMLWKETVITAHSVDITARPVMLHKPLRERKSDAVSACHSNPFKIRVILDRIISNHHINWVFWITVVGFKIIFCDLFFFFSFCTYLINWSEQGQIFWRKWSRGHVMEVWGQIKRKGILW